MSPAIQVTANEGNPDSGANQVNLGGKYLTFRMDNEEYGIEILKVVEIIKMMEITKVPRTPDFVRGVINLRGKIIPVMELRKKFGMESVEDTDETCIIVVHSKSRGGEFEMGILVDTVSEVLDIKQNEIEPTPQFGSNIETDFILGMAKAKGQVKTLLEIDRIMNAKEAAEILSARSTESELKNK